MFDPGGEKGNGESAFGGEQVALVEPAYRSRGHRDGLAVGEVGQCFSGFGREVDAALDLGLGHGFLREVFPEGCEGVGPICLQIEEDADGVRDPMLDEQDDLRRAPVRRE